MKILSLKPGHDGTIVYLSEGQLMFSLEGEKNSFRRYSAVTVNLFVEAMSYLKELPEVVAVSGWYKGVGPLDNISTVSDSGYDGLDNIISENSTFLGKDIKRFSSSHERSHLMCSYGMSPFEQGRPCYALVWEGVLGNFYKIDEDVNITSLGQVIEDINCDGMFEVYDLNYDQVAKFIYEDNIIAWVQGKYEIGPRALGNRSLLASPFQEEMQARLNQIKKREGYRPIAPICLEEDVSENFDWSDPSPYMLYFQKLKTDQLKAVTHVDNTARVQTVNSSQNPQLHELLIAFKGLSGFGVMCNTSLNFLGTGFINEMSDLVYYVQQQKLDGFVVNNKFYVAR